MSGYEVAVTVAIVGGMWIFCMITLGLFFEDVFYEDDVERGEGYIKPKSDAAVILFIWLLAPLTLTALVIKALLTRGKSPASA